MSELNILSSVAFDKFLCSPSNGRIRIRFFKPCQNLAERFPFAHNNNVAGNPYKSLCLQEKTESRWRTNKCFAKAFFSCGKKSLGKKCFAKTIGGK